MSISLKRITTYTSKLIPTDVKTSSGKIFGAINKGRKAGKLPNAGRFKNIKSQTKSVFHEVKGLKFTKDEMPAVVASVFAFIPIPSPIPITPIVYGIGKAIQKVTKFLK